MIRDHKYYDMQIALAATGHLSAGEMSELEQHTNTCATCKDSAQEMAAISREVFLTYAHKAPHVSLPPGMQQRFAERAVSTGVPLTPQPATHPIAPVFSLALATMIFFITAPLGWQFVSRRAQAPLPTPDHLIAQQQPERSLWNNNQQIAATQAVNPKPKRKKTVARNSSDAPKSGQSYFAFYQPAFPHQGEASNFSGRLAADSIKQAERFVASEMNPLLRASPTKPAATSYGSNDAAWNSKQPFRYDLNVASLSLLDVPHSSETAPFSGALKFNIPPFRLDHNRAW